MGEEAKASNGTKQVARASVSQRQLCVSLPVANFQKHHQSDPIVPTSEPRLGYPATRHNSATSTVIVTATATSSKTTFVTTALSRCSYV
jgi:hypothetical protein